MRIPRTPPEIANIAATKMGVVVQAMTTPAAKAFIERIEQKYLHWDKFRIIAEHAGFDAEALWFVLKTRRSNRRFLPFRNAGGEVLHYAVPDAALRELMLIDQQLAGRLRFDEGAPLSRSGRDAFVLNSLMEEAIASSMLEGAATTRHIAKEMLREARRPRTPGERMVANNYAAIQYIREHLEEPLTPEFIVEIQRMLTEGTLDDELGGRLRTEADRVVVADQYGEVVHVPPPASELPGRLEAICAFANAPLLENESFVHPVIRAIFLHFQIAYDHPFCDGNGRAARAVFYWSVLRSGYTLFEFLPISRLIYAGPAKYGRAFLYTETDQFDGTYFLLYHLDIVRRARAEFQLYVNRKLAAMTQARRLFSSDRRLNHRQHAVLTQAIQHPDAIFTIEKHQGTHGTSYATARSDLLQLAAAGYLVQTKVGNRYEFQPGERLGEMERRSPREPEGR